MVQWLWCKKAISEKGENMKLERTKELLQACYRLLEMMEEEENE